MKPYLLNQSMSQELQKIKDTFKKWNTKPKKEKQKAELMAEAFFSVLFTIIGIIILNTYYDDFSLFTNDFKTILWVFNVSFVISIITNLIQLFLRSQQFKSLSQIINNLFFFYVSYRVWTVFPFDTSVIGNTHTWDGIFKALIILSVIGVFIATVVESVKIVMSIMDIKVCEEEKAVENKETDTKV